MSDRADILTVKEAAIFLRLGTDAVYAALRRGKVPGQKVGGSWRLSKKRLQAFIDNGGGSSSSAPGSIQADPTPDHDAHQAGRA